MALLIASPLWLTVLFSVSSGIGIAISNCVGSPHPERHAHFEFHATTRLPNTIRILRLKGAGEHELSDENMDSSLSCEIESTTPSGVILGFVARPEDGDEPPASRYLIYIQKTLIHTIHTFCTCPYFSEIRAT